MALSLILLCVLMVISVPIGMAFGLAGFQYSVLSGIAGEAVASIPYEAVSSFPLLAIPLFLLMGELMQQARLADQLFQLMNRLARRLRYSVGYVVIGTCAFLGAITGSSVATVSAVGGIIRRPMAEGGYPVGYIGALTASAGLLGVLIPPSIPLIIYGAAAGVSVSALFMAAIVPGLIFILVFALVHRLMAPGVLPEGSAAAESEHDLDRANVRNSIRSALPALFMPLVVLGGIYTGVFTPTEAAAVGCLYALAVCCYRHGSQFDVYRTTFTNAAIISGAVLAIVAFTSIFNRVLILQQIPLGLADFALSSTSNPTVFLLVVVLVMFLLGMIMETNSAVLLMAPLLAPVSERYGIDPLQFGVLLVTTIEIGLLTPPMAANVFVASKVTGATVPALLRYVWPFLAVAILVLVLIIFAPSLTTWPKLFRP